MKSNADTPEKYVRGLPEDRREAVNRLREVIKDNLPEGFEETMQYGMIGYVVPLSRYPRGYRDDPKQPLPFMHLASQKNHIAVYHMGLYGDEDMLNWFRERYANTYARKLDMGKSCLRFRNPVNIPYELIGELSSKITVDEWISRYEGTRQRS